jgi:NAD(P)-dependent dehydrogenase (short-subunit alcohol dehydrogenase family)
MADDASSSRPGTRTAIVTGAASGIGLAIAERLAADGLAVAVLDRNGEAASAVAERLAQAGAATCAVAADVSDRTQIDAAVALVADRLGPATVLVNSAGVDGFGPFMKLDRATWDRVLAVNLTGTFEFCQAVVPAMLDAGWGRIVNIASSSAQGGQPYMTHYVASKAGVIGFTKSLALELGPKGITANAVSPGFVDSPMLRASEAKGLLGESVEHHEKRTPVRRVGQPEDIAAMCSYLVRDEASYVTGQVMGVNGGRNT